MLCPLALWVTKVIIIVINIAAVVIVLIAFSTVLAMYYTLELRREFGI